MSCKTQAEVLKRLRDEGEATPSQLKAARVLMGDPDKALEALTDEQYSIRYDQEVDEHAEKMKKVAVSREELSILNSGVIRSGNRKGTEVLSAYDQDGSRTYVVKFESQAGNQYVREVKNLTIDDVNAKTFVDVRGSDGGSATIGEVGTDEVLFDVEGDLATDMHSTFRALEDLDVDNGNVMRTQEFADFQGEVLDTYAQTMTDLGTGKIKLKLFKSAVDRTSGSIDVTTDEIRLRWNPMSKNMRVAEAMLHEVTHKMSAEVFKDSPELKSILEDLRDTVRNAGLDYKVFLQGISNPSSAEIEVSKSKFDYVFDETADVEEFYAYAVTNEDVFSAIKGIKIDAELVKKISSKHGEKLTKMDEILNKLIEVINKVWIAMTGRTKDGEQIVADMVHTIAAKQAEIELDKRDSEADGWTDKLDSQRQKADELLKPLIEKTDEWVDKAKGMNPRQLGKHMKKVRVLNSGMETGVMQYAWNSIMTDTTNADFNKLFRVFRQGKNAVERQTSQIKEGVKDVVAKMYKNVDPSTKDALKSLLFDIDMGSLIVNGDTTEVIDLLNNSTKVDDKIKELRTKLKVEFGSDYQNRMVQVEGLAEYLVSGSTTVTNQQMNANNIVMKFDSISADKRGLAQDKDVIKLVDELVTLEALKLSGSADVKLVRDLLTTAEGVKVVSESVVMYENYLDAMKEDAVVTKYDPIVKGYTQVADGQIRYRLVPEEEVEAQKSVNMKVVDSIEPTVVDGINYVMMVGKVKSVGFQEGAFGLITNTMEGITISSLIRKSNDMKGDGGLLTGALDFKTKKIIEEISNGTNKKFKPAKGQALVPVYNHQYEIVDYRIQMDTKSKRLMLDQKVELEEVLSNTYSRSAKLELTAEHNKKVVDEILENSYEGMLSNPEDYVLVEEYTDADKAAGVPREKRHDRWDYLPDYTKDYIFNKLNHKGIPIHKDRVELMMGEKDITIGNFKMGKLDIQKYPVARARLMAVEAWVKELLSYVKRVMVVLNGSVVAGNTVSNMMVAMVHGVRPDKYVKAAKKKWAELDAYNKMEQQRAKLLVELKAGKNVQHKIDSLDKQIKRSSFYELVQDGQFSPIVEDINVEEKDDGQLAEMLQDAIDSNRMGNVISSVKNGLYIDRGSKLFKTALKVTQYGDAITREIIKEQLEAKKLKETGKKTLTVEEKGEILDYLDQLLVNYGYTMNRWWKYAEQVGGVFFLRYFFGQLKALVMMTKKVPTAVLGLNAGQGLTSVNVADPFDTYSDNPFSSLMHRMMFGDAPGELLAPNIFGVVPDLGSMIRVN